MRAALKLCVGYWANRKLHQLWQISQISTYVRTSVGGIRVTDLQKLEASRHAQHQPGPCGDPALAH
jgi:hypothetical protein